jgi:hypothetical protein
MTTIKRLGLAILFIPLLFNAGFDLSRDYQARKASKALEKVLVDLDENVQVGRCHAIPEAKMFLCAVSKDGAHGLLPVPYEAVK